MALPLQHWLLLSLPPHLLAHASLHAALVWMLHLKPVPTGRDVVVGLDVVDGVGVGDGGVQRKTEFMKNKINMYLNILRRLTEVISDTGSSMSSFIFSSVTLLIVIGEFVTWIVNQSNVLKPKVLEASFKAKRINYLAYADLLHMHTTMYITK